ncbi:MAG: lysoplasmalogenase [Saprospiraceae bacterium]|nr:lysoplasmalogenase [Saprospiraceae bacterium]
MKQFALLLFLISSLGATFGRLLDDPIAGYCDYIFKPFIIPALALYFYTKNKKQHPDKTSIRLFFFGLLFAWGGDLLLMFANGSRYNQLFFLSGLGSFLVMQLFYILSYQSTNHTKERGLIAKQPFYALPFIAIGVGFYIIAFPSLDLVLGIAVAIYACALVSMVLAAINRGDRVPKDSFWLVSVGAFLFMISDMMIGLNKFVAPFANAGVYILFTYCLGQYMIVEGLVREFEMKKSTS